MSSALAPRTGEISHAHSASEALIICSVLAWQGNPLAGLDIHTSYAQRLVAATRDRHEAREILNWRARTDPGTWGFRWAWSRRLTHLRFPDAVGLDALPINHEDIPQM